MLPKTIYGLATTSSPGLMSAEDKAKLDSNVVTTSLVGANNGIAQLDSSGKVPASQLPSYVDDVLEYNSASAFPATGEADKIYIAKDTNISYRWGGSAYVKIASDLALGETSSSAYRGDRGKTAYDHATDASRLTTAATSGLYKVAVTSEGHVASVTAVQKSDITNLGIPGSHQDISGKADKVSGATNGNFAGLDSNGNLIDSGKKATDFLPTSAIDDTAGDGDTNKTWSADKLTDEMSSTEDFRADTIPDPDTIPYIFRKTGNIGDKTGLKDKLIGGTVAWNQLCRNGDFAITTSSGWSEVQGTFSIADKEATISCSQTFAQINRTDAKYIQGHKYLLTCYAKSPDGLNVSVGSSGMNVAHHFKPVSSNYTFIGSIYERVASTGSYITVATSNGVSGKSYTVKNVQSFDLTQMFGAEIADAIYAMEQATEGAGVAWFRRLFPADYYAYNAEELMSVQAASKKTVGFNQWDGEWEEGQYSTTNGSKVTATGIYRSKNKIKCFPSATYYVKASSTVRLFFYKDDGTYINTATKANESFTAASDCYYIAFHSIVHDGICINLSSGRNGEYEPYQEHTYPFDSDLILRGIPKWANGKMYYDGDEYTADGTVTRKYGIVDLGTLTWTKYDTTSGNLFRAIDTNIKYYNSLTIVPNFLCSKYITTSSNSRTEKTISQAQSNQGSVDIVDSSYSDAPTFTTAMSGVYLVYELESPVTESAEPFDAAQKVDQDGTLEYIDERDVQIPVGHDGVYGHYLRMKAEDAPTRDTVKELMVPVKDEVADSEAAMAIVVDGDKAPKNITSRQYVFVKNHSTLATGMYHATAAIASGASITSSNVEADADGGFNAIQEMMVPVSHQVTLYSGYELDPWGYIHCYTIGKICFIAFSALKYTGSDTLTGDTPFAEVSDVIAKTAMISVLSKGSAGDNAFVSTRSGSNIIYGNMLYSLGNYGTLIFITQ